MAQVVLRPDWWARLDGEKRIAFLWLEAIMISGAYLFGALVIASLRNAGRQRVLI